MVRLHRFKSSAEVERVDAHGCTVATPGPSKPKLVRDVTGNSFPELVRNFTRKYSVTAFADQGVNTSP